jgi:hypothetical protein
LQICMINDLMNNRLCSVRFLEPELQWSDKRVDHGPLTRPILTDTGVAAYRASLHCVSRWIGSGLPTILQVGMSRSTLRCFYGYPDRSQLSIVSGGAYGGSYRPKSLFVAIVASKFGPHTFFVCERKKHGRIERDGRFSPLPPVGGEVFLLTSPFIERAYRKSGSRYDLCPKTQPSSKWNALLKIKNHSALSQVYSDSKEV